MPEMGFPLLVALASLCAAEPGRWRPLLQKNSFAGWRSPSGHTDLAGAWTIRDGVLTAKAYVQHRADLWSTEEYEDFELEWEWMAAKAANSGIKYWVQNAETLVVIQEDQQWRRIADPREAQPGEITIEYTRGIEYQMADDEHEPASLKRRDSRAGGVYSLFAPEPEAAKPHGQWNRSRILSRGGRVEHWLNGKRTAAFDVAQLEARLQATGSSIRLEKRRSPIALQYHQTVVSFRKMRIRRW
jgi:hypothetical protein